MNKYRVEVIFKTFIEVDAEDSIAADVQVRDMGSLDIMMHPTFEIDYYWPDAVYGDMTNAPEVICPLCGNSECDGAGTDGAACEFTDDEGNVYETRYEWRKNE